MEQKIYAVTIGMTHFYTVKVKADSIENAQIRGAVYVKRNYKELVTDNPKAQITHVNTREARDYLKQETEVVPVSHKKRRITPDD